MTWHWQFPKYSENWQEIRERVLRRDKYTCQKCGKKGKQVGGSVQLHVAHKKSKSQGGTDTMNNLWVLCSGCHANSEGHQHMRKRENKYKTKKKFC